MNKRLIIYPLLFSAGLLQARQKPNVIIILTDDQGYQDVGCYGSPLIQTPSIDRMAEEGLRLTDFYASASVSSASRAGLLTGRLNTKNGVKGVFFPESEGMPSEEITLAEALKEQGYATGCFGKWHLGDLKGHLPTDQGFDTYYGIPYSNDMYIAPSQQFSPEAVFKEGYTLSKAKEDQEFVRVSSRAAVKKRMNNASPLFEGDRIIEYPCDQATTTRRYFDRAIQFSEQNRNLPFFVYITPSMPHVPLAVSEPFKGKSKRGIYGDAVEEIDWNVGRLLDYLDEEGLSENTLIIYASDNGPWLSCKEDGGSADPLRGGKFSYYEGGVRVPCIIRWEGVVPAGVTSDAIVANIDFFPTILHYAGCDTFKREIDGINIAPFLENPSLRLRDEYVYVKRGEVHGIRKGNWIYLPETGGSKFKEGDMPELFNVKQDVGQTVNLIQEYPEKVEELTKAMKKYQQSPDRLYWVRTIVKIADPVLRNLSEDELRKNIPIGRSTSALASSREFITHMESVGRTIAGIAPWLELGPDDTSEGKLRAQYIEMTCKALANSVNPESDDYFNSTATRQILVNSAFLIQGLLQAPTQLWGNLDATTRERLIEQWKSTRTMKPGNNNWLLFSAMVECGLKEFSGEWNFPVVERALKAHKEWYKGDGIYGDGADFHLDYYNSYVIHPLLLQVLKVNQ